MSEIERIIRFPILSILLYYKYTHQLKTIKMRHHVLFKFKKYSISKLLWLFIIIKNLLTSN